MAMRNGNNKIINITKSGFRVRIDVYVADII